MNFEFAIPFIKLNLINITIKQKKFFDNLFFQNKNVAPKVFLIITITSLEKIITEKKYLIEHNTFANDDDFIVLDTKNNKCKVNFNQFSTKEIHIEIEKNFDLYYLFTFIIEPLMIIWATQHNILFIHASGVAKNNKVNIFPAWRNTGKTNTVLENCVKGFSFVGDDFCILNNKVVYLYPKSLNIFSYNLKSFPVVYNYLSFITVIRLKITNNIKDLIYQLSQIFSGPLSKVFFRVSQLAEVSTNIKVNPQQLYIPICESGIINETILLQKSESNKAVTKKINLTKAKNKIYQIIKYELKDFYELYSKYLYLFPDGNSNIITSFEKKYKELLDHNFDEIKLRFLPKGNK